MKKIIEKIIKILKKEKTLLENTSNKMLDNYFVQYYYDDTTQGFENITKTLFDEKNIYNNEKLQTLKKINKDVLKLMNILEPINNLFQNKLDFYIVGGAVRDYLLNKEDQISDLDILVTFKDEAFKYFFAIDNELIIKTFSLTQNDWNNLNFDKLNNDQDKLNKLIIFLLNRENLKYTNHLLSYKEQVLSKDGYGQDILTTLSSITKINSEQFNYKIDLLVNKGNITDYLNEIDFGICNVAFKINKKTNNVYNIIEQIYYTKNFLKDYNDKTITFYSRPFNINQANISLNYRLPKILEKYKDYNFKINKKYLSDDEIEKINTLQFKKQLNSDLNVVLEEKKDATVIKRNKI